MFVSCFQLGVSGGGGDSDLDATLERPPTRWRLSYLLKSFVLWVHTPMIPQISDPRGKNVAADANRLIQMCMCSGFS